MHTCLSLSIYLSVFLAGWLDLCLCVSLSICPSVHLSIPLSLYLSIHHLSLHAVITLLNIMFRTQQRKRLDQVRVLKSHANDLLVGWLWLKSSKARGFWRSKSHLHHQAMGRIGYHRDILGYRDWLVVLTILKNIGQWEGLSHILWKSTMFETTNQMGLILLDLASSDWPFDPLDEFGVAWRPLEGWNGAIARARA